MQVGLAVLMGKPIGLVVYEGAEVPGHLKKISTIEYVGQTGTTGEAVKRLVERLGIETNSDN